MTSGLRILFVASEPAEAATYRYRNQHLADALNRAGHHAEVVYVGQPRVRVAADIVVLHRISAVPEGIAFARAARACGAILVYSTDDLVFNEEAFPEQGEPWERIRAFAPRHVAMLREADAVLVSTRYLAREVTRLFGENKPVFTIRNFLSDELLRLSERAAGREAHHKEKESVVTLGYLSGTATHNEDFSQIAASLAELIYMHDARLFVVGPIALHGPLARLRDDHGKVRQIPFLPWRELPALVAQLDINLAPLDLRYPFVRAKSEIKYLEAAAAGVPTVATRADGFAEAVPEDTCVFCDEAREWPDRLRALLESADTRKTLADNAYAHLLAHGTQEAQTAHVAETFIQIANLLSRRRTDRAEPVQAVRVNYPFAPPKYWAKALLRRLGR